MASLVPILITADLPRVDVILLDDDQLVHLTWTYIAEQNQKSIKLFYEPKAFFQGLSFLNRSSPVYLDSKLGEGIYGQELVQKV